MVPSSLELKEAKSYKAVDFPLLHGLVIIALSFIHPEFLEAYKGKTIVQNINSSNLQCYSGPQFPNLYSEMVDIDELSVALNLWLSSVSFLLPQHLKASGDRRKLTRNGPLQGRGNCGLLHLTALGVVPAQSPWSANEAARDRNTRVVRMRGNDWLIKLIKLHF